jgi:phospholipase C
MSSTSPYIPTNIPAVGDLFDMFDFEHEHEHEDAGAN